MQLQTMSPVKHCLIFLLTGVASYFSLRLLFVQTGAVILMISLFVHETGHYLTLRKFGFKSSMFFIPFLGAAVSPHDKQAWDKMTRLREATVAFAGPAANVVLVLVGFFLNLATPYRAFGLSLAAINAVLAAVNLLMFGILDGGKIARALFASGDEKMDDRVVARLWGVSAVGTILLLGFGRLALVLIIAAFGASRASHKDNPMEWRSPRSMNSDQILSFTWLYGFTLVAMTVVSALLGNWQDFYK